MHIQPIHYKRPWQIFLLGLFVGALISYILITFMGNKMYETLLSEKIQLDAKLVALQKQNEILKEDKDKLSGQTVHLIEEIQIDFRNEASLKLDQLLIHQLEELIQKELGSLIGKEVDQMLESGDLIVQLIENKEFTVDELSYTFKVHTLYVATTLKLVLDGKVLH